MDNLLALKIAKWFVNGEVGASSTAMASVVLGEKSETSHPLDPDDFNRCLKLVKEIPETENYFNEISKLTPQWKIVIENWEKIKDSFLDEVGYDWSKGISAPNTYKLMKGLGL